MRCAIIQLYFDLVTKYSADDVIRNPSEPRVGLALDGLFFRAASPPADLLRQTQVKKTWCLVRLEGNWIESASTFSCDHPPADDCRFFRTVFFRRIQIRRSFLPSRTMNSFPGKKVVKSTPTAACRAVSTWLRDLFLKDLFCRLRQKDHRR